MSQVEYEQFLLCIMLWSQHIHLRFVLSSFIFCESGKRYCHHFGMCASEVLFVTLNLPVLVLICLHLSVLAHVWSYLHSSCLSCQPCRRLCLPEVLVWTGKLKAQQPWTLSTGMCVLTKGLSAGLTLVFLSIFSDMCAFGPVSMCAWTCACVALPKLGHSSSRIEAASVQQKPTILPFSCTSTCALCVTECEGGKKKKNFFLFRFFSFKSF